MYLAFLIKHLICYYFLRISRIPETNFSMLYITITFSSNIPYPGKLNPTAQKENRGVLGASFRAEEFSEIVGYSNMADYIFS